MNRTPAAPSIARRTPKNVGKVLLIDNYDSFTYNIREALAKLGVDVTVVRNDQINREEIEEMNPSHIILSPGPGTPENPEDLGVTNDAIAYAIAEGKALLGVCLGHQAIGHYYGAKIVQADEILHGKTSQLELLELSEDMEYPSVLEGVDVDAPVMRYHSLAVDLTTLSDEFQITATTRDKFKTIMAMQHQNLPIAGVQFHPESFATPEGQRILENFLNFDAKAYRQLKREGLKEPEYAKHLPPLDERLEQHLQQLDIRKFELHDFPCALPPQEVYARMHGVSDRSFCLESLTEDGGKLSYFGMQPLFELSTHNKDFFLDDTKLDTSQGNAYDALTAAVEALRARGKKGADKVPKSMKFAGGLVGGITYEALQYSEPGVLPPDALTPEGQKTLQFSYYPDGLIYDAESGTYSYFTRGEDRRALFAKTLKQATTEPDPQIELMSEGMNQADFERHVEQIRDQEIRTGNSFQTVLSRNRKYRLRQGSMVPLYRRMRENSPSPNMHAIKMDSNTESIGSFPELVLKIGRNGKARTYQVAGTRVRTGNKGDDAEIFAGLRADPKEMAEHTMLVDLARDGLARCSIPGTVRVEREDFAQPLVAGRVIHIATEVHSRVNGIPHLIALQDVLPMGTVSGAPKPRSMKIIQEHERETRGHYAGAVGFIDLHGNTEFVVELRSISRMGDQLKVQAGAGIVYDSIAHKEYDETQQKMRAGLYAIEHYLQPA